MSVSYCNLPFVYLMPPNSRWHLGFLLFLYMFDLFKVPNSLVSEASEETASMFLEFGNSLTVHI